MKIYEGNFTGAAGAEAARTNEASKIQSGTGSRAGASSGGSDRVELSDAIASLSRALDVSSSGRLERVQALGAQYQGGQYQPDSAATSRAMISEAASGLGLPQ